MSQTAACIQYRPQSGAASANLNQLIPLVTEATLQGASLVTLPEMCLNGYLFPDKSTLAPHAENAEGPSFQRLSQVCKNLGIFLVYGFAQQLEGQFYNSQNLIAPNGKRVATYQKRHLFEADLPWAHPGKKGFLSVKTDLGKIGLGICMDLNFPDLLTFHRRQKTDLLCLSMHWLEEGLEVTSYWLERLRGFRGITLIANGFGEDRGTRYCGQSCCLYQGKTQSCAPPEGTQILHQTLP